MDSTNSEIFIFDLNGSNKIRVTNHPFPDYNPEWLPNGKEIIFYRKHPTKNQATLLIAAIDGAYERAITDSLFYNADPSFSPISSHYSFNSDRDGDHEIFVSKESEILPTQLTLNNNSDWTPDWSPDGEEIVFVSDGTGKFEIYRMKNDGSNQTQLTNSGTENYGPDWSPDGSQIAYFRRDSSESKFDIYIISAINGNVTNLTKTNEWNEFVIGWSANSEKFIFSCEQHKGICSIDINNLTSEILNQNENK